MSPDADQAVKLALDAVVRLFGPEQVRNVGLEELEQEEWDNQVIWLVTIGFSRPWDFPAEPRGYSSPMATLLPSTGPKRDYKVVRVSTRTSEILSIKNRVVHA